RSLWSRARVVWPGTGRGRSLPGSERPLPASDSQPLLLARRPRTSTGQHCLAALPRRHGWFAPIRRARDRREIDREDAAASWLALHADVAPVLLDDPVHGGEAES